MTAALRRQGAWIAFAAALALAPQVFGGSLALTLLTQIATAIVVCLSYNLLLGQGGMLSFGHAVYTGLGAYAAIHAMNAAAAGALWLPVALVPLAGGVAGGAVAALLGWVSTRKAGTPFAMITLGVGELVYAIALMFPAWFGGEGGIRGDRTAGALVGAASFASPMAVYHLAAVYALLSAGSLYALTRTPFGRLLNAVRDNPDRVPFLGHDPRAVRHLAFTIAGFFAGVGGGLAALQFEAVTTESLSSLRSGSILLFTFLGGTALFFGPVIGAVLMVLALGVLSELTRAWQLYLGLAFIVMVIAAPGGLAGLLQAHGQALRSGAAGRLAGPYGAVAAAALLALAGSAALVEMAYHRQLDAVLDARVEFLGQTLDSASPGHWLAAAGAAALGVLALMRAWPAFQHRRHAARVGPVKGVGP